jgi:hypothetical protein
MILMNPEDSLTWETLEYPINFFSRQKNHRKPKGIMRRRNKGFAKVMYRYLDVLEFQSLRFFGRFTPSE